MDQKAITPKMLEQVALRFQALGDPARLRILMRLRAGEANVGTLAEELDIAQASVSKHLAVLKQVGLVAVRRQGNQSFHWVADTTIFDLCSIVCDGVKRHHAEFQAALSGETPEEEKEA